MLAVPARDVRPRNRLRELGLLTILAGVDALEHPVGDGQMIHCRREQMVGDRPLRSLAVDLALDGAVRGQVLDQCEKATTGELAAVPVEEIGGVVAEEIRLKGLGVFVDELDEAQSSPRPSPVSLP
ncbi:hypothetical protein [Streptomyces sp. NPDC013457]|uniref:hypothetical protein n=1 Tax=Streptomyces sp. NPDC013457 TaxID=3364866 RepID=UPI0037000BD8